MKTIIVLGMHRSATSLIAKGLHEAGVNMGVEMLGPGPGNEQGHYEDMGMLALNDKILEMAGGSWDNPPPEKDIQAAGKKLRLEIMMALAMRQCKNELWGWKDPRTTLTIRCFTPWLTSPIFVPCFRSVLDVALSLHRRDGMESEKAIKLANEYNSRLLKFLKAWESKQFKHKETSIC
jgi:hypothetical protein